MADKHHRKKSPHHLQARHSIWVHLIQSESLRFFFSRLFARCKTLTLCQWLHLCLWLGLMEEAPLLQEDVVKADFKALHMDAKFWADIFFIYLTAIQHLHMDIMTISWPSPFHPLRSKCASAITLSYVKKETYWSGTILRMLDL